MTGSVNLLQIEIFAESTKPQLQEERLVQVEELVSFVVVDEVCLFGKVFSRRQSRGCVDRIFSGSTVLLQLIQSLLRWW